MDALGWILNIVWWILDKILIVIIILFVFGFISAIIDKIKSSKKTHKSDKSEYNKVMNDINNMSVSELKQMESILKVYGTDCNDLWAFVHPEWSIKDYESARFKKIKNGPIYGCFTYGDAADMYTAVLKRLHNIN